MVKAKTFPKRLPKNKVLEGAPSNEVKNLPSDETRPLKKIANAAKKVGFGAGVAASKAVNAARKAFKK